MLLFQHGENALRPGKILNGSLAYFNSVLCLKVFVIFLRVLRFILLLTRPPPPAKRKKKKIESGSSATKEIRFLTLSSSVD